MATMCEELVGLLTMLPGNWLVNDYVFEIGRGDAWRQYLYGLRKTCRPKSPADLPAKSHSQIHSEPVFTCRLSFLTGRHREKQLVETHLRAAIKMLETMSYLRGAVAKAGQAIASMPELVPDQFIETLGALHFQAPPMHYSLIREQLMDELGSDPEEVFAEFETKAIAAASLGQVHRARLKTG